MTAYASTSVPVVFVNAVSAASVITEPVPCDWNVFWKQGLLVELQVIDVTAGRLTWPPFEAKIAESSMSANEGRFTTDPAPSTLMCPLVKLVTAFIVSAPPPETFKVAPGRLDELSFATRLAPVPATETPTPPLRAR